MRCGAPDETNYQARYELTFLLTTLQGENKEFFAQSFEVSMMSFLTDKIN